MRRKLFDQGFNIFETGIVIALLVILMILGWYVYKHHHVTGSSISGGTAPTNSLRTPTSTNNGTQPPVPRSGAYVGAWLNNSGAAGANQTSNELDELPGFNQSIGRKLSIVQFYPSFNKPLSIDVLNSISQNGAIPLISWNCTSLSSINSGADNTIISAFAAALKTYAKPVFMRWYWEMNLNAPFNQNCGGYHNGPLFVTAWKNIWNIFHTIGANNVAFVWNPSVGGGDAASYYPGNSYVDWIACDGYDRSHQGAEAFTHIFTNFYNEWSNYGKPIMIGETGATSVDQAQYIEGIQQVLPTSFQDIKALLYWSASGTGGDFTLQGDGLTAFKALVNSAYFSY